MLVVAGACCQDAGRRGATAGSADLPVEQALNNSFWRHRFESALNPPSCVKQTDAESMTSLRSVSFESESEPFAHSKNIVSIQPLFPSPELRTSLPADPSDAKAHSRKGQRTHP